MEPPTDVSPEKDLRGIKPQCSECGCATSAWLQSPSKWSAKSHAWEIALVENHWQDQL